MPMKEVFRPNFWLSGLLVFAIALTLSNVVRGQDKVAIEGEEYDLEEAIDILAENQLKLTNLLRVAIFGGEYDSGSSSPEALALSGGDYDPFDGCLAGYSSWPNSGSYDEDAGPFEMTFPDVVAIEEYTDINGDGNDLADLSESNKAILPFEVKIHTEETIQADKRNDNDEEE